MLKRLFLAASITFPLYFLLLLDGSATSSAHLRVKVTEKADEVIREIKEEISEIHQELNPLKNPSSELKNFKDD